MKLVIVAYPDEPEDIDEESDTGLTEAAYDRLVGALMGAGLSIGDIRQEPS